MLDKENIIIYQQIKALLLTVKQERAAELACRTVFLLIEWIL